ncbi:hypothetical protein EMPS_08315 [Entomortierella parvispora]|uniref:Protein root UVB sensitive/RUS domain-containing protein n=1 Tax=Entomortierella parvispora TaxID=205924 RepID=A0A9P3HG02_9FUNG|nr:hypothetical protein EMPS_08315 [Entomortierella parvispora]
MLPHSVRVAHAASPQVRWTRLIKSRQTQVISTRSHLHPRIITRFITTDDPASDASQRKEPSSHSDTFTVRQRKSGTWLPKWMTLTMSKDQSDNTFSFQPSPTAKSDTDGSADSSEKTVEQLLSPQTALAVFLPKGFPESVTPNYWPYAKWQFVHNVTGSVSAVISTQSLLFAMGLGAGSIPMAAALNWIIKDGLGQLGGVVYASFVSDKFDSEPKRFRFQATVAMQGANVLELLTPLWPGSFLLIASVSNIGKNMAWLASSATRAQMNKTFALRDNLGDITGKSGSQTTAAGLVGTGLGVVIAAMMNHVSADPTVLPLVPMCLTFLPFSIFNIYSNYRSSHYVTTPSLNVPRAETVFHGVLKDLQTSTKDKEVTLKSQLERIVPTPKEIAHDEVFVTSFRSPFNIGIDIEPAISRFSSQGAGAANLERALRQGDFVQKERYYIMVDDSVGAHSQRTSSGTGSRLCKGKVVIWFDKTATSQDVVQGFYHACATRQLLSSTTLSLQPLDAVRSAHSLTLETVPRLVEVMESKGWDTESLFLTDGDRDRIHVA